MSGDLASIEKHWLLQDGSDTRLATEAIAVAVSENQFEIAERIWIKQWHGPSKVYQQAWDRLFWVANYGGEKNSQKEFPSNSEVVARANDWLIEKVKKSRDVNGVLSKAGNFGCIAGLKIAALSDDMDLWDHLLALKPDLSTAAANEVFRDILIRTSFWPSVFLNRSDNLKSWVNARLFPDFFEHGFRPGGSLWVGAAMHDEAEPLLEYLLSRAAALTTPRQRTAILVQASEALCPRFDLLARVLLPLGAPEEVKLTPSEIKRLSGKNSADIYLENRSNDGFYAGFVFRPFKPSQFSGESNDLPISLREAIGQDALIALRRTSLQDQSKIYSSSSSPPSRRRF